jgi:hypothetical protein
MNQVIVFTDQSAPSCILFTQNIWVNGVPQVIAYTTQEIGMYTTCLQSNRHRCCFYINLIL